MKNLHERKGYYFEILIDEDAPNPMTNSDHLGVFVSTDRSVPGLDEVVREDEIETLLADAAVSVQVYGAYGGEVGWLYCTRKRAKVKDYFQTRLSTLVRKLITRILEAEASEFQAWAKGECYGYVVYDAHMKIADSCGGYYGYRCAIEAAEAAIDDLVDRLWLEQTNSGGHDAQ